MLQQVISPARKGLVLAGKPASRDHVMAKAGVKLKLQFTEHWPPDEVMRSRKYPNGYVLRPLTKPSTDPDADEALLKREFKKAMNAAYASQKPIGRPCVLFVDEASLVQNDLGLKSDYEAPLTRGAPDVAVWSLLQRSRYSSYHAYSAPEHLVLFYDPDEPNLKREAEMIGGIDPRYIVDVVQSLKLYRVPTGGTISEALYIKRAGPEIYIVDVK